MSIPLHLYMWYHLWNHTGPLQTLHIYNSISNCTNAYCVKIMIIQFISWYTWDFANFHPKQHMSHCELNASLFLSEIESSSAPKKLTISHTVSGNQREKCRFIAISFWEFPERALTSSALPWTICFTYYRPLCHFEMLETFIFIISSNFDDFMFCVVLQGVQCSRNAGLQLQIPNPISTDIT